MVCIKFSIFVTNTSDIMKLTHLLFDKITIIMIETLSFYMHIVGKIAATN